MTFHYKPNDSVPGSRIEVPLQAPSEWLRTLLMEQGIPERTVEYVLAGNKNIAAKAIFELKTRGLFSANPTESPYRDVRLALADSDLWTVDELARYPGLQQAISIIHREIGKGAVLFLQAAIEELQQNETEYTHELACEDAAPTPTEPHGQTEQWHATDEGTAFARPFGTIRACRHCGCLVAGGPTACVRCAESQDAGATDLKPNENAPISTNHCWDEDVIGTWRRLFASCASLSALKNAGSDLVWALEEYPAAPEVCQTLKELYNEAAKAFEGQLPAGAKSTDYWGERVVGAWARKFEYCKSREDLDKAFNGIKDTWRVRPVAPELRQQLLEMYDTAKRRIGAVNK